MTSDLDASTADLYNTIRRLWQEAQSGANEELAPPPGYGESVVAIRDEDIASVTGLDLAVVREYLDHADGTRLVIGRDGDARAVKAVI
ncbi:hypothetical protein [Nocardioides caldifontis]|uniref:hypothetical protein n=1 Tax=Nocardioides caldifontis TaxID=2588938 RepID=UPI0011DFEBEB|nr:hypothetical protein [Nocardioides caldifontis]